MVEGAPLQVVVLRILLALVDLEGEQIEVEDRLARGDLAGVKASPVISERRTLRIVSPPGCLLAM